MPGAFLFKSRSGRVVALEKDDGLIIQYPDKEDPEEISSLDLIAVLPVPDKADGSEYTILYLRSRKIRLNGSKKEETHYEVQRVRVSNLPERILKEYLITSIPRHLSVSQNSETGPNIHALVSTRAGICEAERFFNDVVRDVFDSLGLSKKDYEVHYTTSDQTVKEFTSNILLPRANAGIAQTVLLLSGDGGIVDVVNVLLQATQTKEYVKPSFGLLALGTGNALANSTGLNRDSTRGLRFFFQGCPHSLPTFAARFSAGSVMLKDEARKTEPLLTDDTGNGVLYGTVVCSWALHASLVADSDTTEYRKFGSERFIMAAKQLLFPSDGSTPHTFKGSITIIKKDADGKESLVPLARKEHAYILVALCSNMQKELRISPDSKPLEGQLRFVHWGAVPSEETMRILGLAFAGGKHVQEPGVCYEPIEGLRIDFDEPEGRWRRICVDGTIVRAEEGGWVEVRREQRDVLDLVAVLSS